VRAVSERNSRVHGTSEEGAFYSISRLKLPKRDRAPEPRKVWPKGKTNLMSKSRAEERKALTQPRASAWLRVQ
jgi:hypothetical protein